MMRRRSSTTSPYCPRRSGPHKMPSPVRPELSTASVGTSQAPTAAVDNSAPYSTRSQSTYKSGKAVQTTGATSVDSFSYSASELNSDMPNVRHERQTPACRWLSARWQGWAYRERDVPMGDRTIAPSNGSHPQRCAATRYRPAKQTVRSGGSGGSAQSSPAANGRAAPRSLCGNLTANDSSSICLHTLRAT